MMVCDSHSLKDIHSFYSFESPKATIKLLYFIRKSLKYLQWSYYFVTKLITRFIFLNLSSKRTILYSLLQAKIVSITTLECLQHQEQQYFSFFALKRFHRSRIISIYIFHKKHLKESKKNNF